MNVYDFVTVWVILLVNAFTGLLEAVLIGIVMAAFTFAYQYGQTTVIQSLISGDQFQSGIVRASFPPVVTAVFHANVLLWTEE